jgi:acyl carrier protein
VISAHFRDAIYVSPRWLADLAPTTARRFVIPPRKVAANCPAVQNILSLTQVMNAIHEQPEQSMEDTATTTDPTMEQVEQLIINALRLEEAGITAIDPDSALFGSGLGLDSIDALELALAIAKAYGVTISSEDPNIQSIFASLKNITAYIQSQRAA